MLVLAILTLATDWVSPNSLIISSRNHSLSTFQLKPPTKTVLNRNASAAEAGSTGLWSALTSSSDSVGCSGISDVAKGSTRDSSARTSASEVVEVKGREEVARGSTRDSSALTSCTETVSEEEVRGSTGDWSARTSASASVGLGVLKAERVWEK